MSASPTSHVLARSGGGKVTEFTFAAGAGLAEHATPYEALVAVMDGELRVSVGGEPRTVRQGETVRFPPGVPHALYAPVAARMLLVLLHADR